MKVALAKGDGIGPEIMLATLDLFAAAGVLDHVEFVPVEMGASVFAAGNSRGMTDEAVRTVEEHGLLFKGPMETPKGGGGKSINVTARKLWGAFANVRRFRSLPGVETVYSRAGVPVDFTIVRENIEDTYGGIEHRVSNDTMQCKRIITAPGSDQVHRFTFQTARRLGVRLVHCGHKANIMKLTDGLFLDRFRALAREFPDLETKDVIIDALCMELVVRPQNFKLVVLPNLQGDIVSDLAAGLVGGLGFAPSANIGLHISIFEAVHGTAPDIAGKGIANPTSLILSGIMLLQHIGLVRQAARIENALLRSLEDGVRTGDFGRKDTPALGTREFVAQVVARLGRQPSTGAVPDTGSERVTLVRSPRPSTQVVMRTFSKIVKHVVGCDVYIDEAISAMELADQLNRLCADAPFRLTMISNRGTQIWPTGSVYTECVDYFRARFELRPGFEPGRFGQGPVIALLDRITERFAVTCFELLRTFDGTPGYSLAQGQ
ncbi:MAG: isocitrate dehydrogenase [Phycisphaerae bacterium]|nr:isocitrate dehydrogenase [Phycisphaerae bacterium]